MTGKIYIAAHPTLGFANLYHTYLIYDPDGVFGDGDEQVIRGGPPSVLPPFGPIIIAEFRGHNT
jgi:hypothetical protein